MTAEDRGHVDHKDAGTATTGFESCRESTNSGANYDHVCIGRVGSVTKQRGAGQGNRRQ